jgi:cobalamin biosynthesis Mg chelatase CobN
MRRLKPLIAFLVALAVPLGGLMAAGPAMAYNLSAIYKECEQNGQIDGHYSRAELQAAINQLPSEVSEYSDCQVLIQQALVRASSHKAGSDTTSSQGHVAGTTSGGKGGSGGSSGGTPAKTGSSKTNSGRSGSANGNAVNLAGSNVRPGSTSAGGSSSLPVALIVVLVLLALTAVSGGVVAIRRRVNPGQTT